ncbi:hypothetical protein M405DRAFT_827837 [Rhizopogon salebrosus TDB-379]|nr:hypothetical protein M405DRAFT_827837 [Rhizopogon salebrosus TDB-379]
MVLSDGVYKLQSAARPTQYATYFGPDERIVGNNGRDGQLVNNWIVTSYPNSTVTFEILRLGAEYPLYISPQITPEGQYLTLSREPFYFYVQESPQVQNLYSFGIPRSGGGSDDVWALLGWENNTPVIIQGNTGSTQELWVFERNEEN